MHAAKTPRLPKDPDRTREDILRVAAEAFSRDGLAGARVDDIAELTQTSKRMIYYYFEGKEGLYRAFWIGVMTISAPAKPPLTATIWNLKRP